MRRSIRGAALLLGVAATAACNLILGIEEQGPRPSPQSDEGGAGTRPQARDHCTIDDDCAPPNGCYRGRCDPILGACSYALCSSPGRACATSSCNPTTMQCEGEKEYGFRATRYAATDVTLGCAANASACVAAAFPFLFIGTKSEVVALVVDDLQATRSRSVPVAGPKLEAAQIVVSGRRVWVLGVMQGTSPPYHLPILTIDVPSDPTIASIPSRLAVVRYAFPTATAFPAPDGAIFLTHDAPGAGLPTARLTAPVADGAVVWPEASDAGVQPPSTPTFLMHRMPNPPANGVVVASSGERLVLYRAPAAFNLVTAPGTAGAKIDGDMAIAPPPAAITLPRFAQGPDGAVLQALAVNGDAPGSCDCASSARMQWVLPNALATTLDANQVVDFEAYSNPTAGGCHTCQYFAQPSLTTWIDSTTAVVAASAGPTPPERVFVDVRAITRDPVAAPETRRMRRLGGEEPSGDFTTDRITLTSSGGYAYLVLADRDGNKVDLSIFDPRCDAR